MHTENSQKQYRNYMENLPRKFRNVRKFRNIHRQGLSERGNMPERMNEVLQADAIEETAAATTP